MPKAIYRHVWRGIQVVVDFLSLSIQMIHHSGVSELQSTEIATAAAVLLHCGWHSRLLAFRHCFLGWCAPLEHSSKCGVANLCTSGVVLVLAETD